MQILRENRNSHSLDSIPFIKHGKLNFNIFCSLRLSPTSSLKDGEKHKKFFQLFVSFTIFCSNGFSVESSRPIQRAGET